MNSLIRCSKSTVLFLAIAGTCAEACAHEPPVVTPNLAHVPQALEPLSFSVDKKPAVSGYWAGTKLGPELARALAGELEATLSRAGYVVDRQDPDLVVKIAADLGGSTKRIASTTTLELLHDGQLLDRVQIRSPDDLPPLRAERYPEQVAVRLANALAKSTALRAFASEPRAPKNVKPVEEAPVADRGPPAVVVFDVLDAAEQLDPRSREQLSEYIGVRMTQWMRYRVMPRARIRDLILTEKANSYKACSDQGCQIELGKALAAQKMLATKLLRVGATCAITTTLFDLRTETAELATSVKTKCGQESLLQAIDELVEGLKKEKGRE